MGVQFQSRKLRFRLDWNIFVQLLTGFVHQATDLRATDGLFTLSNQGRPLLVDGGRVSQTPDPFCIPSISTFLINQGLLFVRPLFGTSCYQAMSLWLCAQNRTEDVLGQHLHRFSPAERSAWGTLRVGVAWGWRRFVGVGLALSRSIS